jgi:tyrosyl-tRNA synthetase
MSTPQSLPSVIGRTAQLRDRLLVHDVSDEVAIDALPPGTPFYLGVDPTAPYLHIGNLIPLIVAIHLAKSGLKPIMLFGGSTGSIGDPSGRSTERSLLSRESIDHNIESQSRKVKEIFSRYSVEVEFVNNYDWTKDVSALDFLRDVGKHFTVNYMIAKEVIKTRLEGEGISYTELSYMLLQAFDYWHLYQTAGCKLQVGGSDQWGNITAGLELIRKKGGAGYALSAPLILDSEGRKFGKSAGNALWLDENGFSPYQLHQYFLNTSDADVLRYLTIFTLLSSEEITHISESHTAAPHERLAQKVLADELTTIIHGAQAVTLANHSAKVLFGGSLENLSAEDLLTIFKDVPSVTLPRSHVVGALVTNLLLVTSAVSSKGEAKRAIEQGGAYLGTTRIESTDSLIKPTDLIENSLLIIRIGKKKFTLVQILD